MPWATLRKIVFFCCQTSDEIQEPYDESSHLIPAESVESPMIYSDLVSIDHQQVQERLGLIVRTKEGKMVNVASQIPFNLHNKVLPSETSYGSISRSASASQFSEHDCQTDYGYSNHGTGRQRKFFTSIYDDGHVDRRQILKQPMPTPILNVRLVGYTNNVNKIRGRTRERQSQSSDTPDSTHAITRIEGEDFTTPENAGTSCEAFTAASSFKLRDVGSITLNWND